MARTYLTGSNSRGNLVTAANSKDCYIRGWNAGVKILVSRDEHDKDEFLIYMSAGSGGYRNDTLLGTVTDTPDGPKWTPYYELSQESSL